MVTITQAVLEDIQNILVTYPAGNTIEHDDAARYLKQLIKPYVKNPSLLTSEKAETLTAALRRFCKLRGLIVPQESVKTPIYSVIDLLKKKQIVTQEEGDRTDREINVTAQLLKEIFNAKASVTMEGMTELQDSDCDYALAADSKTSIANLFNKTDQDLMKKYFADQPLIFTVIELGYTSLFSAWLKNPEITDMNKLISCTYNNQSLVSYAVDLGKVEVLRTLFENGFSHEVKNDIKVALNKGDNEVLALLVQYDLEKDFSECSLFALVASVSKSTNEDAMLIVVNYLEKEKIAIPLKNVIENSLKKTGLVCLRN